jgi:uncharacterized protein YbjT (DUF2867 family)
LNVDKHYGDIFDTKALRSAMDGCDNVFLLRRRRPRMAA